MKRAIIQTAVAATVAAVVAGGVAYAAVPDGSGVIHGCYKTVGGALKVIDTAAGQTCTALEKPLNWNQGGSTSSGGFFGRSVTLSLGDSSRSIISLPGFGGVSALRCGTPDENTIDNISYTNTTSQPLYDLLSNSTLMPGATRSIYGNLTLQLVFGEGPATKVADVYVVSQFPNGDVSKCNFTALVSIG